MNKNAIDAFHEHLDKCSQCRENPFGLCAEGVKLITATQTSPKKGQKNV